MTDTITPERAVRKWPQYTHCEDCGNPNLLHDEAIWTSDGSSYCPGCRPDIVRHITPERAAELLAQPEWPPGFFRLHSDARLRECASDGCFWHVSMRVELSGTGSDHCEPCARRIAGRELLTLARQQRDRIADLKAEVVRLTQQIADDIITRDAADDLTAAYLAGAASGAERMRERAAQKATSFLVGDPSLGVPLRNPYCHEVAKAIRALPLRDTPAPGSSKGRDNG